jgi:hypothetical protein
MEELKSNVHGEIVGAAKLVELFIHEMNKRRSP